jgi:Tfp pilus assembly protein PilO
LVKNRTQLSIYVVGAMLLADFILFGYWPSQQRLRALQQARARQQSGMLLADVHRPQVAPLDRQRIRCERALAVYHGRIPTHRELGSFLQQLSDVMMQHQLQDQVIIPGGEVSGGGLVMVPVTVRCRGSLADLHGFYRQVDSIGRLMRVEKVQFTNDPDLGGCVRMEAQMVIFYRADGASGGDLITGGGASS